MYYYSEYYWVDYKGKIPKNAAGQQFLNGSFVYFGLAYFHKHGYMASRLYEGDPNAYTNYNNVVAKSTIQVKVIAKSYSGCLRNLILILRFFFRYYAVLENRILLGTI